MTFDDDGYEAERPAREAGHGLRPYRRILIALTLGIAAIMATAAMADWRGHGARHGGFGHDADPEAMREHVSFALEWGLRKLEATPEQQTKIQAIADDTLTKMLALRDERHADHAALRELVLADELDREAIDALRAEHIALADRASRELVAAATDAFEVLTPEQRRQLVDHLEQRRHRRWLR